MKDELTPLEREIQSFQRQAPPGDWKEEILAAAQPDPVEEPGEGSPIFGPLSRVLMGGIAACWVLIGLFHFSTPKSPDSRELAERYGVPIESLPLFAVRAGLAQEFNFTRDPGS